MCDVRKILRHSRARGNSLTHYPNARKKYSVIPAKAGIHIPAYAGIYTILATPIFQFPSFPNHLLKFPQVQEKSTSFPRTWESLTHYPNARKKYSVIPAKAGIHIPAYAGIYTILATPIFQFPSFPNHLLKFPQVQEKSTSFPRRRE